MCKANSWNLPLNGLGSSVGSFVGKNKKGGKVEGTDKNLCGVWWIESVKRRRRGWKGRTGFFKSIFPPLWRRSLLQRRAEKMSEALHGCCLDFAVSCTVAGMHWFYARDQMQNCVQCSEGQALTWGWDCPDIEVHPSLPTLHISTAVRRVQCALHNVQATYKFSLHCTVFNTHCTYNATSKMQFASAIFKTATGTSAEGLVVQGSF